MPISCPSPISIALSSARSSRASSLFWFKRSQDSFCPELHLCFPWGSITDAFAPMRCSRLCDERWVEREVELKHWTYSNYSNYSNSVFDSMLLSSHRSNSRTGYSTKVWAADFMPWKTTVMIRDAMQTTLNAFLVGCCFMLQLRHLPHRKNRRNENTNKNCAPCPRWNILNFHELSTWNSYKDRKERSWESYGCSAWIQVDRFHLSKLHDIAIARFLNLCESLWWLGGLGTTWGSNLSKNCRRWDGNLRSELVGTRRTSSELVGTLQVIEVSCLESRRLLPVCCSDRQSDQHKDW